MNMDRLTDLIPIQRQTYTETCVDYAERKIDCTSDTICGRTGVETELNMRAGSLTIRVSVLPLHYTTTTTIGGGTLGSRA